MIPYKTRRGVSGVRGVLETYLLTTLSLISALRSRGELKEKRFRLTTGSELFLVEVEEQREIYGEAEVSAFLWICGYEH